MNSLFERTHIIAGDDGVNQLKSANILIAGLGGVGSFAAEAIARMGVGNITIVDHDVVSSSNLNRQLVALSSTLGKTKAEVMKQRILDINPDCRVVANVMFLREEDIVALLEENQFDYIIDAIDSIGCKVSLLKIAHLNKIKIISSMGAGNKVDPTKIEVSDIKKTYACPLARFLRRRLKEVGIRKGITAVFSSELPSKPLPPEPVLYGRDRAINGTVSYMPGLFGLTMAGYVIKSLLS